MFSGTLDNASVRPAKDHDSIGEMHCRVVQPQQTKGIMKHTEKKEMLQNSPQKLTFSTMVIEAWPRIQFSQFQPKTGFFTANSSQKYQQQSIANANFQSTNSKYKTKLFQTRHS